MKTKEEKLEQIDEILASFEDWMHGEEGDDCTKARRLLSKVMTEELSPTDKQWKVLKEKFFAECTENIDGVTLTNLTAHSIFEWFKQKIISSNLPISEQLSPKDKEISEWWSEHEYMKWKNEGEKLKAFAKWYAKGGWR